MIVETHVHLVADDLDRYPPIPYQPGMGMEWARDMHLTGEEFLALMDEAGVDKATLVQGRTIHGYDNSYVADVVARHPDRFVGLGAVEAWLPTAADTLRYWVTERGLHGVRLLTYGPIFTKLPTWLDDPATDPFWACAAALGVPVDVQTPLEYLPRVRNVAERHSDLRLIIEAPRSVTDGDGDLFFEMADCENVVAMKFKNWNLDGSKSDGVADPERFLRTAADTFGVDRMMWGTNFPESVPAGDVASPYKAMVDDAHSLMSCLNEEEQRWVRGDTAVKVFADLA